MKWVNLFLYQRSQLPILLFQTFHLGFWSIFIDYAKCNTSILACKLLNDNFQQATYSVLTYSVVLLLDYMPDIFSKLQSILFSMHRPSPPWINFIFPFPFHPHYFHHDITSAWSCFGYWFVIYQARTSRRTQSLFNSSHLYGAHLCLWGLDGRHLLKHNPLYTLHVWDGDMRLRRFEIKWTVPPQNESFV